MRHRRILGLLLVLLVASLAATACSVLAGKPTVVIASPPSGSQFREGEEIAVQSTSTDSAGIVRVELIVDGTSVRSDPSPGSQAQASFTLIQTWKATQGTHTISVRAYNAAGAASDPASISVSVLQATALAGTATPAAPTATLPPAIPTITTSPRTPTAATPDSGACTNDAVFVADVTVPDGTVLAAGQTFDKTWRIKNNGTCAWGAGYQLVFVRGEAMTASTVKAVPNTAPGATADLKVAMKAPVAPGTHLGEWRLRSPSGTYFGHTVSVKINVPAPSATATKPPSPTATATNTPTPTCSGMPNIASFTASPNPITPGQSTTLSWGLVTNADSAEIDQGIGGVTTPGSKVVTPGSTTTYALTARCGSNTKTAQVTVYVNPTGSAVAFDFVTRAPEAQWCGAGPPAYSCAILVFNASDTDPNGFAVWRQGVSMEDGSVPPGKVLETHPKLENAGVISGTYPAYRVQSGDHFRAKFGFLSGASTGNVTIQLNYKESNCQPGRDLCSLGSWPKAYNGSLITLDVDLASIDGHNVQFALVALANGSSDKDWATWVSPRIER